ncbi:hypothetical protein JB92DRAFT_2833443 [Gautieria morchelliformis]|nr:hypothetical protein JB92DRAFT_2833443 [Gautieria morchelliformis]
MWDGSLVPLRSQWSPATSQRVMDVSDSPRGRITSTRMSESDSEYVGENSENMITNSAATYYNNGHGNRRCMIHLGLQAEDRWPPADSRQQWPNPYKVVEWDRKRARCRKAERFIEYIECTLARLPHSKVRECLLTLKQSLLVMCGPGFSRLGLNEAWSPAHYPGLGWAGLGPGFS